MVYRPSQQVQSPANGVSDVKSPYLGSEPDHIMVFSAKDIVDVSVASLSTTDVQAKSSNGRFSGIRHIQQSVIRLTGPYVGTAEFRTDTDISGNFAARERTLKRWEPAAEPDVDLSLESSAGAAGWDQFEANERLFGATTNYDETFYTTRIDRSDPSYKRKEAEAARIAREIESSDTNNAHVREERSQVVTGGDTVDEEEKYSGVRRDEAAFPPLASGQPNKYTTPARRQQQAASAAQTQPSITATASTTGTTRQASQTENKQPAAADVEQRPGSSTKAATPVPSTPKRPGANNATGNVETEVLDHFRQFANSEKLKMQERRRNQASYDRNIKLNELLKFSRNFKLATPVPTDLVPILAKDRTKQEIIMQKSQKQADEKSPTPPSRVTTAGEQQQQQQQQQKLPPRGPQPSRHHEDGPPASIDTPPSIPPQQFDRQGFSRNRHPYAPPPGGPQGGGGHMQHHTPTHPGRGGVGTGMLSHRLTDNLQARKGSFVGPVPTPLDVRVSPAHSHSGVSSPSKTQTPTSSVSSKFNVRALEFRPNPAASTFTPGSSPMTRGLSTSSRAASPSMFFGPKKLLRATERPSIADQFNPIKRLKKEAEEETDKDYSFNGGIPPAYKTPPTWDVAPENEEKKYTQMFRQPVVVPSISPQVRTVSTPQFPAQFAYQFPQTGPSGMPPATAQGAPQFHPQQASGPLHFDDHRMQVSASQSQMFPSPRPQNSHMAYSSPMATPQTQLAAFAQPMPQFYMGQATPQPGQMRPYTGAPQFVNPQAMGAPMMVQQPSGGPYVNVPQGMSPYAPQMQMYSPSPAHAYPQHVPPPQPHSGYPSPSRAPIMMHQGSQPGQPPQPMFMSPVQHGQPMYSSPGHSTLRLFPSTDP